MYWCTTMGKTFLWKHRASSKDEKSSFQMEIYYEMLSSMFLRNIKFLIVQYKINILPNKYHTLVPSLFQQAAQLRQCTLPPYVQSAAVVQSCVPVAVRGAATLLVYTSFSNSVQTLQLGLNISLLRHSLCCTLWSCAINSWRFR